MRRVLPLVLLLALALGVGSAGGHSLAGATVTVEVIGKGRVTSVGPSGIECGDGKKVCFLTFPQGAGTITLLPSDSASGWSFQSWDGCTSTSGDNCVLTGGSPAYTVSAQFGGPGTTQSTLSVAYNDPALGGTGDVTGPESGPPGTNIDCGSTGPTTMCSWSVLDGSTLTVFETPAGGNVFSGWGGACSGANFACTVEMDGDQHVSAAWVDAASTALLTVAISGSGKVKGGGIDCPSTCSATEPLNSSVTLTATPSSGYAFSSWTGACALSTVPTCTFTTTVDTDVTATFVPANTLSVQVNGNGAVSGGAGAINCGLGAEICSANFAANATVTLLATPATGATFTGWTGACGGTATTCTVLMSSAKSVTATFAGGGTTTGFALSVTVSGNGAVTGGGINCGTGGSTCSNPNVTPNSTVTLVATPSSGATFGGWGGACTGTIPTCTVVMNSAKSVSASFQGGTSTFQLSVTVSGAGTVTGGGIDCGNGASVCTASETAGSTVTLTATAATGATFTGWGGACSGSATTCVVTMNAAKSVSAGFTAGGGPGTLTIVVSGQGTVSTSGGSCAATGPQKTCVQHFKAGAKVTLTATRQPGASFLGWSGSCTGAKTTCTVTLTTAKSVTARFSGAPSGGPTAVLRSIGPPIVKRAGTGFRVTLRFTTTAGGLARVRGLRAGRVAASLSFRVAAGRATIGPFPVAKPGFYTFEVLLAGRTIRWRTCLGLCGTAAKAGPFVLTREPPKVTRTGDVWSATLHAHSNRIFDGRIRVYRGRRLVVNQHFLGRATELILGPFLLGPGSYTLQLTATDEYGRVRTLTWIVALAR